MESVSTGRLLSVKAQARVPGDCWVTCGHRSAGELPWMHTWLLHNRGRLLLHGLPGPLLGSKTILLKHCLVLTFSSGPGRPLFREPPLMRQCCGLQPPKAHPQEGGGRVAHEPAHGTGWNGRLAELATACGAGPGAGPGSP